jgi:glycine cleavage system regulatory protein
MSGEPLFKAAIQLSLPETSNVAAIRRELEQIAANLLIDISLEPLEASAPAQRIRSRTNALQTA